MQRAGLQNLPNEVLRHIFSFCGPRSKSALMSTCRDFAYSKRDLLLPALPVDQLPLIHQKLYGMSYYATLRAQRSPDCATTLPHSEALLFGKSVERCHLSPFNNVVVLLYRGRGAEVYSMAEKNHSFDFRSPLFVTEEPVYHVHFSPGPNHTTMLSTLSGCILLRDQTSPEHVRHYDVCFSTHRNLNMSFTVTNFSDDDTFFIGSLEGMYKCILTWELNHLEIDVRLLQFRRGLVRPAWCFFFNDDLGLISPTAIIINSAKVHSFDPPVIFQEPDSARLLHQIRIKRVLQDKTCLYFHQQLAGGENRMSLWSVLASTFVWHVPFPQGHEAIAYSTRFFVYYRDDKLVRQDVLDHTVVEHSIAKPEMVALNQNDLLVLNNGSMQLLQMCNVKVEESQLYPVTLAVDDDCIDYLFPPHRCHED